jgi:catenin alpha
MVAPNPARAQQIQMKWNLENLEIRTKSVEKTLEPLVTQVTTLVNCKNTPSNKKKGKSKKAQVLVAAVDKAIKHFIEKGSEILRRNPEARDELGAALDAVKSTGTGMVSDSQSFAQDPCSSVKRSSMVKSARALLSAVARLLIVADMIDVQAILKAMQTVQSDLEGVKGATSQQELQDRYGKLRQNLDHLSREAGRRANDLKDTAQSDDLQAARALLKTNSPMLYSATKSMIRHPEIDPARSNRDFVYGEMSAALGTMQDVIQGQQPRRADMALSMGQVGGLMAELDKFGNRIYLDPHTYKDSKNRPELEELLERIISGAALIADASNTREDRKQRIVTECNAVRQALQDLLSEYERNAGRREPDEALDMALVHLGHKAKDLKRHLRRAVVDHVSDAFLDTRVPLLILIDAAKRGDQDGLEDAGRMFLEHAQKLVEVADLACAMSNNEEGIRMARYAASQVEKLGPQVVNAARILAARPQSKVAQENMEAFRDNWEEKVRLLTLAVDSVITIDDFLAVSETHIVEDVKACIRAAVEKDGDTLDRTAGAIRGRSLRVCDVVDADMDLRAPDAYTEKVKDAVRVLRNRVLPEFAGTAEKGVRSLGMEPQEEVDIDEFIEASSLVHEAIRDIRHAVLMNRDPGDIDSDEEYEEAPTEKGSHAPSASSKQQTEHDQGGDNQRAIMRQLPVEEKKKIQEQIDVFKVVQTKFEREVAKWDDAGNDIIVLAKYMCMIMMEMTDFTRGRGPLKTTMDVINASKKISEAGSKLNALAKQIGDECVASETKKDLDAYMQRITLYCHQLNITSRVKADVQQVGDELIVSGLESAMSLIQTARNLLNAVVSTVKSAYIASTKYPAKSGKASSLVVWNMRAPEKKPLVRPDVPQKPHGIIRRASHRREMPPIKALAEFNAA